MRKVSPEAPPTHPSNHVSRCNCILMLKQIRRNEISSPKSVLCKTKRVYSIVVVASMSSACTVLEGSQ